MWERRGWVCSGPNPNLECQTPLPIPPWLTVAGSSKGLLLHVERLSRPLILQVRIV